MTQPSKRLWVAWSACARCLFDYGNEVKIGYDKISKKWFHLTLAHPQTTWDGYCLEEPEPMEVMV